MSAHMRTRHTNISKKHAAILYVTHNHTSYAIPKKIAEQYVVKSKNIIKGSVPAKIVFEKLEKKLTKSGALLKGLRTREGLTQINFAKKIKVTQANLSNMENGRRPIGKTVAMRIGKLFDIDYRYFLE